MPDTQQRSDATIPPDRQSAARNAQLGYLLAIGSALALSTMGPLGKLTMATGVDPLTIVTWRAIIAAALVTCWIAIRRAQNISVVGRDLIWFALLGFVGISLNYLFFFRALELTSVSTAITLVYTYPIMVTVFAALLLGEPLTRSIVYCVALATAGCFLTAQIYDPAMFQLNRTGLLYGAGAAITKTIYTLISKHLLGRYDPQTIILYAFGFGAAGLVCLHGAPFETVTQLSKLTWLGIVTIAIVPTLIGYSMFVFSMKFIEAGRASIVALLEPLAAVVLALIVLGEVPETPQILGGVCILVAVVRLRMI
ncbi:MAG: EamA family transporter [Rhodobacteraceae bacterium]|nr:EamA family transporter [Paracoccaceae bacterium]